MIKTRKQGLSLIIFLFIALTMFHFIERPVESAATLPSQYYFIINGQQRSAGTEYEMTTPELLLNVTSGTWEPTVTVDWITSEPGVVTLEGTTYGNNFVKLVRKAPGYSTITAVIKDGSMSYSISCLIKVDLAFDYQKTGVITSTTTMERILLLNNIADVKKIYLKYVDYIPTEGDTVAGEEIIASAVLWESDNEGVVTVDVAGNVKAVGSGSANITVKTNTMSSKDKSLQIKLRVVVKPTFQLSYDSTTGVHYDVNSVDSVNKVSVAMGVPSNIVINSNATMATNLKWEIYDFSTGKKISPSDTSKLSYTVSSLSGNVSINNIKAGTYEIFAFANDQYNVNTNAPYAYMKIVVPIHIEDQNVIMNVGDTFNILENSNIPNVNIFEYYYVEGNSNIARLDQTTGIITGRAKGSIRLRLVYKTAQNLYDNAAIEIDDIYVNVTVIDGIALSATSAKIYTAGKLLLTASVTNPTAPIVWSSSDTKIVTVKDGLVTGVKAGIATITASQTINGVVKKATCEITVQQSVEKVTINPNKVNLKIGDFKTLLATITPSNLNNVTLNWRSSDEAVVKIVETSPLTTTIQGIAGGNAVIAAINQDNVVVGYSHVIVNQPVTSMTISETSATVDLSMKQLQLRATVYPENAVNQKINWKSSDPSRARVNENGLVTLLKPGTVSIIATSDDNPKITQICNLTIRIPVVSVTLDETSKIMYVGQSARLSYLVLPADASNRSVTWTSTNNSVVAVDNSGKVTAKGVGTAVIILRSVDGGHAVYCTISVRKVATGVKLNVSELELKAGEYYYLKATLTPTDSTDTQLVWESSDTKVATVDEFGKVVAKSSGIAIIQVRTEAGGVAYCKIKVTNPVKGLILNFTEKTVYVGKSFELIASVTPSDASNLKVTWTSSNLEIATVSKNGEVKGIKGGTAIITATTVDGNFTANCVVTVREDITKLKLNYDNYSLGIKKTVVLIATAENDSATNQKVKWVSSNTKVATVNKNGKVTGKALGYATITAIAQDGSEAEASCEIRVVNPVTSVTLNTNYIAMFVGDSRALKSTVKPSNATFKRLIWKSSDDKVAIVDEDGVVTGLSSGTATITAEAMDNSGKKALCVVNVRDRVPSTGITVADKKITMVAGEEKIVQVVLNPQNSTDGCTWTTDNAAVARVDKKTGKITARNTGTAIITVMTDSGKTAMIEVSVIGLNITELTLEQYTTYPYQLRVEGTTSRVTWSIDNPNVAVVTNGRVSTRGAGKANIYATVNGRTLVCKLTVTKIR